MHHESESDLMRAYSDRERSFSIHIKSEDIDGAPMFRLVDGEMKPLTIRLKPDQWYAFHVYLKAEGDSLCVIDTSLTEVPSVKIDKCKVGR